MNYTDYKKECELLNLKRQAINIEQQYLDKKFIEDCSEFKMDEKVLVYLNDNADSYGGKGKYRRGIIAEPYVYNGIIKYKIYCATNDWKTNGSYIPAGQGTCYDKLEHIIRYTDETKNLENFK